MPTTQYEVKDGLVVRTGSTLDHWLRKNKHRLIGLVVRAKPALTPRQRVEFNLEFCASLFAVNNGTATTGSGFYTAAGSDQAKALINNNTSVDTTIAQALAFTVILPVANANVSTNLTSALVEII